VCRFTPDSTPLGAITKMVNVSTAHGSKGVTAHKYTSLIDPNMQCNTTPQAKLMAAAINDVDGGGDCCDVEPTGIINLAYRCGSRAAGQLSFEFKPG
jgi:hypothetical protein